MIRARARRHHEPISQSQRVHAQARVVDKLCLSHAASSKAIRLPQYHEGLVHRLAREAARG